MASAAPRGFLVPRTTLGILPRKYGLARTSPMLSLATRTALQTRTVASVRDLMRETKNRGDREMLKGDAKAPTPSAEMAAFTDQMRNRMLLPGTFVPLPLSKYPRQPGKFLRYLWATTRSTWETRLITWGYRLQSMPKGSLRPAFKPQTRQIVPTAKALHRRLNEALAAGDLTSLREVCHEPLYDMLSRTIQSRNAKPSSRKEKMDWEVVEYHSPWRLPRLAYHRATLIPESRYGQQAAVVTFDTTQRLTKRDAATGEPIKGGTKVQRKRENLVIMRAVDGRTYEPEEWRIWGFEPDTTLQAWESMERGKKLLQTSGLSKRAKEFGVDLK
ncbi:hypothetical protein jhhlp_003975 [Lomentospora prolificans]|uniref:Large ribosomal subunit protein mL45 n=1 Tax=Lomentospora prolificans TaxID=41688 RepID=A0A2N3NAB8_9PEZI|nr:hypothetical protein jhhlp_003975 [Lomentospora prolificans]